MLSRALIVRVGRESTPGTTATNLLNLLVEGEQLPLGDSAREMLAVERSSVYQHDAAAMVQGLQRKSPCKLALVAKYPPSQLGALATAPAAITASTALSQELILEHWLGGRVAGRGSTVVSSADARTVTVTATHGARFTAGMMAVFYVAGAPHVRQITAIATDTLTVYPDLPASPATGQAILGSRTYHRAEAHTQTLTVEAANAESGTPAGQQRGRMVRGQCAWSAEIGARAMLAFDGVSQAHDLGDLSIPYTVVADDMGADVVWQGASFLFPSGATAASPTATCIEKLTVAIPNTFREQACLSGVEGAAGVLMTGGRTPPTIETTQRWDVAGASIMAAFAAGTTYTILAYATRGATTAQAWEGWFAAVMAFDGEPTRVNVDGEVMVVAKWRCLANTTAAGAPLGASSTDATRSPIVHFLA